MPTGYSKTTSPSMAAIVAALYMILMVESMTGGVALYRIIDLSLAEFAEKPAEHRNFGKAIEFGFYNLVLTGYILSLPCFCYALHKRHGKWLYPYMIWRILLCVLIGALAIFVAVSHYYDQENGQLYLKLVPPATFAVVLGLIFFALAFFGMRHFAKYRIGRVEQLLR